MFILRQSQVSLTLCVQTYLTLHPVMASLKSRAIEATNTSLSNDSRENWRLTNVQGTHAPTCIISPELEWSHCLAVYSPRHTFFFFNEKPDVPTIHRRTCLEGLGHSPVASELFFPSALSLLGVDKHTDLLHVFFFSKCIK